MFVYPFVQARSTSDPAASPPFPPQPNPAPQQPSPQRWLRGGLRASTPCGHERSLEGRSGVHEVTTDSRLIPPPPFSLNLSLSLSRARDLRNGRARGGPPPSPAMWQLLLTANYRRIKEIIPLWLCLVQQYHKIFPRVGLMLQLNCLNSVQKYVYTQQNP